MNRLKILNALFKIQKFYMIQIKTRIKSSSTEQNLQLEADRSIHQKKHPIIVREKLNSFIPPKEWKKEAE